MPIFNVQRQNYKFIKPQLVEWSTFRKGLNLLLRPTELGQDELAEAQNIMLIGSGVPTGRWGTALYFNACASLPNAKIRGIGTFKNNDGSKNEIFVLTDEGYLAKKNGTSYTVISGQSWPSGSEIHTEQLGGKTYIVSENVPFTAYDGNNLEVFATISPPTGLTVTNLSGATGSNVVSWKVVALSANGGQTTPSANYVLENLPNELSFSRYLLRWTAPSAATLGGYEIYRGKPGDETWLASVGPQTTSYLDLGGPASEVVEPPITNTTGGVKSKFICKYKDRLVVVPSDDPNKLMISGRYPDHTKFNWADGGGSIYIDPNSGDVITGIAVQPIADRLVVYKNFSSYLVELQMVQVGNYFLLDPQVTPISTAVGCSSQDTIATVENDTFYFGRNGLYVTGYEPNFLNIIRTNEISARIRPYLQLLSEQDYETACAMYVNNKYILSFPLRKEMIVYDRERGCFVGPWKFPFGIRYMKKYIDSSGSEKWVLGCYDSPDVYTFEPALNTDNGEVIVKKMKTGKNYMGDWTRMGVINYFYSLLRNIIGKVTVNIYAEDKDGKTSIIKTFTITGTEINGMTGWGTDLWGTALWGDTNMDYAVVGGDEVTRWGSLFKPARLVQVEMIIDDPSSNAEFLATRLECQKMGAGSLSGSSRV